MTHSVPLLWTRAPMAVTPSSGCVKKMYGAGQVVRCKPSTQALFIAVYHGRSRWSYVCQPDKDTGSPRLAYETSCSVSMSRSQHVSVQHCVHESLCFCGSACPWFCLRQKMLDCRTDHIGVESASTCVLGARIRSAKAFALASAKPRLWNAEVPSVASKPDSDRPAPELLVPPLESI